MLQLINQLIPNKCWFCFQPMELKSDFYYYCFEKHFCYIKQRFYIEAVIRTKDFIIKFNESNKQCLIFKNKRYVDSTSYFTIDGEMCAIPSYFDLYDELLCGYESYTPLFEARFDIKRYDLEELNDRINSLLIFK